MNNQTLQHEKLLQHMRLLEFKFWDAQRNKVSQKYLEQIEQEIQAMKQFIFSNN